MNRYRELSNDRSIQSTLSFHQSKIGTNIVMITERGGTADVMHRVENVEGTCSAIFGLEEDAPAREALGSNGRRDVERNVAISKEILALLLEIGITRECPSLYRMRMHGEPGVMGCSFDRWSGNGLLPPRYLDLFTRRNLPYLPNSYQQRGNGIEALLK